MRRSIATLAILTSALAANAASQQQNGWELLNAVQITETETNNRWYAFKEYPDALRASADGFEVTGYYVPIEAQPYVFSFLLVQDPADCPFCGGGGYGPVLEVRLRKPVKDLPEFAQISVRGDLEFIEDPETLQAYKLTDAVVLSGS